MKTKLYKAPFKMFAALTLACMLSCHLLQKDKQILKKLSQKEELQILEQLNTHSQQSQLMITDSGRNDFMVVFWPKGKFTFSVVKGFEGEAEKMMITSKLSFGWLLVVLILYLCFWLYKRFGRQFL